MTATDSRLDRDAYARGFVRAAQYLANMLASADVLAESRELIRSIFAPDFVCFCRHSPLHGECALDCALPIIGREALRRGVDQVIDTGFMAMETFDTQSPVAAVILPVSVRGRAEAALVIGYRGERELPSHALEALLGVAGLVGATLARQRADRELLVLADERAARAIAEGTERMARLLSEASKALFASFDYDATLASITRLLVPQFADWCAVEVLNDERPAASRQIAVVHVDPSNVDRVCELRAGSNLQPLRGTAMTIGEPEFHSQVPDSLPAEWARDPEQLHVLRNIGLRSAMVVPMGVHGSVFGAIAFASFRRRYGTDDLALAQEIGLRAGTAIENARLYRQAQQAIGVRDQFLAVASHELRTPLSALTLVIEQLERSFEKLLNSPERLRDKIAVLSRLGRRLSELVGNLLDVTRIQAGRLEISMELVDLSAVVREVVERHGEEALRAGCALEVAASEPVVGTWDQSRVDQVVSNLLSNAIKYGAGKPVSLVAELCGDTACLSVTDRGMGIAPDDHERIFQRFERAVRGKVPGMGLGLWITREIVKQLEGSIHVESRVGQGAQFKVELPVRPALMAK